MVLLTPLKAYTNRTFLELLKTVYGINFSRAMYACGAAGVSPFARVGTVPERVWARVESFILSKYKVGRDARQILQTSIKKLQNIHCYRATRMEQGLPAHGQRTRSNSKTAKKFGRVKNLYFRSDVHRFRSDDPTKGYIRKNKGKKYKPIFIRAPNTKFNTPYNSNNFNKVHSGSNYKTDNKMNKKFDNTVYQIKKPPVYK
jgi:small subunit ribosomal protein S13